MKKGFMALIIVGTFFLSSAVAQAVVIGFDDITTNGGIAAWNGDRYQAQGVTFSTDGAGGLFAYGGGTYTNTLPNYAYGSSIGSGTAANSKIIATFSSPVNFVSFYLADGDTGTGSQWLAEVFDGANTLLNSVDGTTNDEILISFSYLSPSISKLVFTPSGDSEGIDTLTFPCISGVPEPTTMLLLGSGLVGLVGLRRKFRK